MYIHVSKQKISKFFFLAVILLTGTILTLSFRDKFIFDTLSYITKFRYGVEFNSASGNTLTAAIQNTDNANASSVPVLLYHGITLNAGLYNMTPDDFKNQMFALKRAGYKTVTLNDFYQFELGQKTLPAKSFLLTFDDARRDSYVGADPILSFLGYNAVMFVPTQDVLHGMPGAKGYGYYLKEADLANMVASKRWELGSHGIQTFGDSVPVDASSTEQDFLSNKMWLADKGRLETDQEYQSRVENELVLSKQELHDKFGVTINAFAYPSSDYGQQSTNNSANATAVIGNIMKQNYAMAFEQVWPDEGAFTANFPGNNMLHLKRVEPRASWTPDSLVAYLNNSDTKATAFNDYFALDNGWKRSWGDSSITSHSLVLKANASTTGAGAILDGTYSWQNYGYFAEMNIYDSGGITLMSRFQDSNNYLTCNFSTTTVRVDERVDGITKTILTVPNYLDLPKSETSFGMLVNGSRVNCFEGSSFVALVTFDQALDHGGIGIQVWDRNLGAANIAVKSIKVVDKDAFLTLANNEPIYAVIQNKTTVAQTVNDSSQKLLVGKSANALLASVSLPYLWDTSNLASIAMSTKNDIPGTWYALPNKLAVHNGVMSLGTTPQYKSAFVTMQGGLNLTDYSFDANIDWVLGSGVSLLARYANSNNYIACEYNNIGNWVQLIQELNGKRYYIAGAAQNSNAANLYDTKGKSVGVRVNGAVASCLANGQEIVKSPVPTMPTAGTVGFNVYASTPGMAMININSVKIIPETAMLDTAMLQ